MPDNRVFLNQIYYELPDFNTPYLEATLHEDISQELNIYHVCFLIINEEYTVKFSRESSAYSNYNYVSWGNITICEPILYYDAGKFYIVGKNKDTGNLLKLCLDEYSYEELQINADTANVEDIKILKYDTNRMVTFVQNSEGSYSFYYLGNDIFTYNIDAEPEDIVFNKPFIDKNEQLVMLIVHPSKTIDFKIIESDVKRFVDAEFFFSTDSFFLFEKNDGTFFVFESGNNIIECKKPIYLNCPEEDFSFILFVDEFGRCFLKTNFSIGDMKFYQSKSEFICDIPRDKLHDDKVKNILNIRFSYSEKNSTIEQLLSYIKD